MKELKEAVKGLVREEYERAAESFGEKFNSPHEAYAVILEEMEEANAEFEFMGADMNWLWRFIKKDERHNAKKFLKNIELYAINTACECIQVAAMAYKASRLLRSE